MAAVPGSERTSGRPGPPGPLEWVKPPQQARSQATLERLLDAAEALILEQGVSALTVSEVARRANSSVGAFYARFPDKDALLSTLHARSCDEARATAAAALDPARWASVDIERVIVDIVRFTAMMCEQRLGLLLAFIAAAATDRAYAERRAQLEAQMAELLLALLGSRQEELSHPDLETSAAIATRMILSTLEYGALIHRSAPRVPPATLAAELTRAVTTYLGVPVSGGRRRPA